MSRTLTNDTKAELTASVARPIFLFYGEFEGQTLRLCTSQTDKTWDSETWTGNSWLSEIGVASENSDGRVSGATVVLDSVPSLVVSLALSNVRRNKVGKIYLGFLDSSGSVIDDPAIVFSGRFDSATVSEAPNGSQVTFSYESVANRIDVPKEHRLSNESQRNFYIDDRGLEYVESLSDWRGYWGKASA